MAWSDLAAGLWAVNGVLSWCRIPCYLLDLVAAGLPAFSLLPRLLGISLTAE
jgi:hypothetical protein